MNYEPGKFMDAQRLTDASDATPRSRPGWLLPLIAVLVLLAGLGIWYATRSGGGAGAADQAKPKDQVPSVTVIVPGRQQIARDVSATGTLAARVDMPVGVAGEGGLVQQVLVQPGDWVRQGQVLATIDRSVQEQTQAQQAASIAVARADARLAQAELDRAEQLVARGFVSKADIDRRTATRDAALARVKVAEAQLAETRVAVAKVLAGGRYSLVTCYPRTGRTHQIRVHLAGIGTPILADDFYGNPTPEGLPLGRQALHARRIEVTHPVTEQPMVVEAPLPPDMQQTIALLRGEEF